MTLVAAPKLRGEQMRSSAQGRAVNDVANAAEAVQLRDITRRLPAIYEDPLPCTDASTVSQSSHGIGASSTLATRILVKHFRYCWDESEQKLARYRKQLTLRSK